MPELPEVETIKEALRKAVEGAVIQKVIVRNRKFRIPVSTDFEDTLEGAAILKVYRIAKYAVLDLDNGFSVVWHFGMSGKEAVRAVNESDKAREHYHKKYIPGYQNDTLNSDLCINSAYYSIEEAAELITQAARMKFGEI